MRTKAPPPLLAALALGLLPPIAAPTPARAQGERLEVEKFLEWENVGDPRISPDGSRVVYARGWVDKLNDRWNTSLWELGADGSRNRFLLDGSNPRWSPDGSRIAFLAEGEPSGRQIHVRWMDAEGATSQITRVTQPIDVIAWSPDSRWLALRMLVPDPETWSIDMPSPPEGARWTEAPRVVDRMHYRQDFRGFTEAGHTHLFLVPAEGGTPRQLTDGRWNVGARFSGMDFGAGIDWTPDGREIVFDGLMREDADTVYMESHLYAVNVETGNVRQITSEKGRWTSPVVSPDGRLVAFTGYPYTEQTYRASELWVIGRDGSDARKISGDLDRDPGSLHWADDGSGVYFTAGDRGSSNVWFADLQGNVRQVTEGTHMLSLSAMTGRGVAVGVRSGPHAPGDVVRYDLRRPREITQLTRVNEDVLTGVELGEVEEVWYTSTEGARVQGWIVKPPAFDPSERYPLILHIHGGPHAMYNVAFSFPYQNFAANGYVVLYTNPRGSTGYGTDFGNAIDKAYPSVDYDDLMAGVDTVVGRGYIDTDRMYVTGCSGGGVLSSWVIGHTDRFAASAVRCPVINWLSFAGNTDITLWGFKRFGDYFWRDPEPWLRHSPLMYVENVTTPTLIMTGELDLRTPMAQSEEYYQALKLLGVPVKLLRFHGEYHGTGSKPTNFMRTQLYIMDWFGRWSEQGERTVADAAAGG